MKKQTTANKNNTACEIKFSVIQQSQKLTQIVTTFFFKSVILFQS